MRVLPLPPAAERAPSAPRRNSRRPCPVPRLCCSAFQDETPSLPVPFGYGGAAQRWTPLGCPLGWAQQGWKGGQADFSSEERRQRRVSYAEEGCSFPSFGVAHQCSPAALALGMLGIGLNEALGGKLGIG